MINVKKIVIIAICIAALSGGIFGINYLISLYNYKKIVSEINIKSVDLSNVHDGTYTGSCDAIFVGAEVEVTVKDKKITDIKLLNHKTEKGKPAEVIVDDVKNKQSLQVDAISGATNSSKVILKAIENALESGES
ncbi:FMN-binding domain protein [Clostridium sp. DL-VIII]|uniref:FMN-binding protein n=1 Tax=Clostridium sp. DL-VIII TaxID=641107 RepID=UPI00023AFE41|nr:FMN-binding protein [Clostridium sp. DL-VIII]EHJ00280.1 FMN-binding domain protein [Clostridium sp. DL-VIII]